MDGNTLISANRRFIDNLKNNPDSLTALVETMAKYHKYSLYNQINIHLQERKQFSALASKQLWAKSFGTDIVEGAKGIFIIDEKNAGNEAKIVYDISDTVAYKEGRLSNDLVWRYDEAKHNSFFQNDGNSPIAENIIKLSNAMAVNADAKNTELLSNVLSVIILTRTKVRCSEISDIKRNIHDAIVNNDIDIIELLNKVHDLSKEVLNPLGLYIKALNEREMQNINVASKEKVRNVGEITQYLFANEKTVSSEGTKTVSKQDDDPVQNKNHTKENLKTLDLEADMSTITGKRAVFKRNLAAIRISKELEKSSRKALPEEIDVLKSYSGFGGLAEAFDEYNESWSSEYKEIRKELTDDEFASARSSVLNAHFTPDEIIQEIYIGLKNAGFEAGNILEPACGTGKFFSNMPADMKANSHIFGVELDLLTSRIAQAIHNNTEIINQGFEKTTFPDNSFDVAISNIPFGNYSIDDIKYRNQNFLVHDYFIAKMIDQIRPGGLVIAITSHGTMDKKDDKVRKYLAKKASLVRAIRLPNNAFKSAGTEVTADILILKKREKELTDTELSKDENSEVWLKSKERSDLRINNYREPSVNNYFSLYPEHVLGNLAGKTTAYGISVTCNPTDVPLKEQLKEVFDLSPVYQKSSKELPIPMQEHGSVSKPFGYYNDNEGNLIYINTSGQATPTDLPENHKLKISAAIYLRDTVYQVLDAQERNCSDTELKKLQEKLNNIYDDYVKQYSHIVEDTELKRIFGNDASYPLLCSIEIKIKDKSGKKEMFQDKGDIFFRRTLRAYIKPTHADNAEDALKISMKEKGKVAMAYMSQLTDMPIEALVKELEFTSIYRDMESNEYKFADEYLSGDIYAKIENLETMRDELEIKSFNNALAMVTGWKGTIRYTPKNEIEKTIMECSPKIYRLKESDYQYLSKEENYECLVAAFARNPEAFNFYGKENNFVPYLDKHINNPSFIMEAFKYGMLFDSRNNSLDIARKLITATNNYLTKFDDNTCLLYAYLCKKFKDSPEISIEEISNNQDIIRTEFTDFKRNIIAEAKALVDGHSIPEVNSMMNKVATIKANLEKLEQVKPKALEASDITVNIGATWIPANDIKDFIKEMFAKNNSMSFKLDVHYSKSTNVWHIDGKNIGNDDALSNSTYGTSEYNAFALTELALNLKEPKVYKTVYIQGKEKKIVDVNKTVNAQQKMELIKSEFVKWLWQDETRSKRLVKYYNRHFNNIRPREYDGQHLDFPGMNCAIKLKPHQKDAVAHTLYGGNTLLAHCVGAGKTFEMVASIMESKRLGLSKKSMVIVPKHLTEQFGAEFINLYPNAKILVATQKDFQKENRLEFCSKIATQNWDAIIMGYSQFEKIPISPEREEKILETEINKIIAAIADSRNNNYDRWSIKQIETKKKQIEAKLCRLKDNTSKDNTINFEQLGVDRLYVDEAHYFKNLYTATKMSNVAGIQTSDAQKTQDLYNKCQYLNEITNGHGIVFATGTPISNSMTELYTMQRYLQPDRLRSEGLNTFDDWASTFGKTVTALEISPEGKGFREKTRFSKFYNLPELMSMFKEIADIKTPDMINLPVPEVEYAICKMEASDIQKKLVAGLADRAEAIRSRTVDSKIDNMLKVTNEGRCLALDPRIIDTDFPDEPGSKVNMCVKNVHDIYEATKKNKSTQMIFSDLSTPTGKGFTVYQDIKDKLIKLGVKEDEIAFIHDAKTEQQKDALFAKVRKGEVRIILGSTQMMGVGTNVQDKLICTHDLDVPWKPSDLEQRLGRIVRQGNTNEKVKVQRYVTEGTFDAYMWQLIENKQRFISQIMTSKTPVREAEDVDEVTLSYSEVKALATGNPLIKEKMELDNSLERIKIAKAEYLKGQQRLEYLVTEKYPQEINQYKNILAKNKADKTMFIEKTKYNEAGDEIFEIVLNGQIFNDAKQAGQYIATVKDSKMSLSGEYKGMKLALQKDSDNLFNEPFLLAYNQGKYRVDISKLPVNTINRLKILVANMNTQITYNQNSLEHRQENLKSAQEEIAKPFSLEKEFAEKLARSKELELLINENNDVSQSLISEQNNRMYHYNA